MNGIPDPTKYPLKDKPNKASRKPKQPEVVCIKMTPKLYEAMKEERLKSVPGFVRGHVNTYFEFLKSIKPEEVVDAIDNGVSAKQAYKNLGLNPIRFGIAAARGFLKAPFARKWRDKLREIATYQLAITTLEYENPRTFTVIQNYGEKGCAFLQNWIDDALQILGVNPDKTTSDNK